MANRIDIGCDVQIEYRRPAGDGPWWGVAYFHPDGKGGTCEGWIPFNGIEGEKRGWDVLSVEPLTLSPSLLCRACGHHGFIREGKWVPA
jgi:hypothetical protein